MITPKVINGYRGNQNDAIERFFAGCVTPNDFLDLLDKNGDISQVTRDAINNKIKEVANQKKSNTGKEKQTVTILFADEETDFPDDQSDKLDTLVKLAVKIVGTENKILIKSEGFAGKGEVFDKSKIGAALSRKSKKTGYKGRTEKTI